MLEILIKLFIRDLEKLKTEISSYKDEKEMWEVTGAVINSAGNLCLHICGNLQHFIGAVLGDSGYVRKRNEEFSRKKVPLKELLTEIDETLKIVNKTLNDLNKEKLAEIIQAHHKHHHCCCKKGHHHHGHHHHDDD